MIFMGIDLNFYPEDHPEEIAEIPYLVAGYDLSGFDSFANLVECVDHGKLMLWEIMYDIDDDGQPYRRNHKLLASDEWRKRYG